MANKQTNRTPKKGTRKRSTADWADRFLAALEKTGNIFGACQVAKVSRSSVYERRDSDTDFAHRLAAAIEVATDALELEARRRGHQGTLKPVFQGGKKVGQIREYSDTLLIFLLKAHRPAKYRDTTRHEVSGVDGGPIKNEHAGTIGLTVTQQVDRLAEAFEKAADRAGPGDSGSDGNPQSLDSGTDQGRSDSQTS